MLKLKLGDRVVVQDSVQSTLNGLLGEVIDLSVHGTMVLVFFPMGTWAGSKLWFSSGELRLENDTK